MFAESIYQKENNHRLERHRAFWKMAPTDRPIIGIAPAGYFAIQRFSSSNKSGYLQPDEVDINEILFRPTAQEL